MLCCYVNATSQLQVARLANHGSSNPFKRVVFPGERLLFEALPESCLEIYIHSRHKSFLSEQIFCKDLQVKEPIPSFE